jgi:FKBP-type peptidyl-prolyl cis-trans isomerase
MIRKLIPGALALGLIATTHAEPPVVTAPAEAATKVEATTPAVEVPAKPKLDPAVVKSDSSYGLGYRTGGGFLQQFGKFGVSAADLEMVNFIKGFTTSINGGKPELSEEKLQAAMQAFGEMLQEREKVAATANLEAGKKFLAENGKRKEVTTTKSGLQYEVLTKGGEEKYVAPKDAKEGAEDKKQFLVNYKGTLIGGKQFDASPEGQPVPMTLEVVPGFKEALTTMPVGAKWKLFLPSELAYGEQRRSADIAPNSALIFELELVKIQDAPAAPEGGMPFQMPPGQPGGPPEGAPSEPGAPPAGE